MMKIGVLLLVALPLLPASDELVKPEKVPVSTWVREDLFAGWIANDPKTQERGMLKVDRYLQDHPDDPTALAWKYFAMTYNMRDAMQKKDSAGYAQVLASAERVRKKIFAGDLQDPGAYIIVGSSLVGIAYWAPAEDRTWMYRDGRELLNKVPGLQEQYFDKLPPHMRGELWTQIAFASDRLGDAAERDRVLNEIATKLAGSPYETRARGWMKSGLGSEKQYTCISCHEPGRLAPTMARLKAN